MLLWSLMTTCREAAEYILAPSHLITCLCSVQSGFLDWYPFDPAKLDSPANQEKEVKNGRLAMVRRTTCLTPPLQRHRYLDSTTCTATQKSKHDLQTNTPAVLPSLVLPWKTVVKLMGKPDLIERWVCIIKSCYGVSRQALIRPHSAT